jgi:hypothetical protein
MNCCTDTTVTTPETEDVALRTSPLEDNDVENQERKRTSAGGHDDDDDDESLKSNKTDETAKSFNEEEEEGTECIEVERVATTSLFDIDDNQPNGARDRCGCFFQIRSPAADPGCDRDRIAGMHYLRNDCGDRNQLFPR